MSLLLGGLAARRAGLGCRGSGRFFLGPASNRLVFGDAALCVFGGVVGRPRPPLGRLRAGRRRCMPRVDARQQQALGLFSFEARSEERRVGKECISTCRSRWAPSHYKKKITTKQNYT